MSTIEKNEVVGYLHYSVPQSYGGRSGGVTVAYACDAEPDAVGRVGIRVAFAFCSPQDAFVRAVGRVIASGRLAEPQSRLSFTAAVEPKQVSRLMQIAVSELFCIAPDMPAWAEGASLRVRRGRFQGLQGFDPWATSARRPGRWALQVANASKIIGRVDRCQT